MGREIGPRVGSGKASPRDSAISGFILGVAAMMWFGWGQERPPAGWSLALVGGSMLSFAVIGIAFFMYLAPSVRAAPLAMRDPRVRRSYHIVVGAEVAACVIGAVGLWAVGLAAYIAPWILAVVGAHLARLFAMPEYRLAGLVLIVVAGGGAAISWSAGLRPSFLAGASGGLILAAAAGYRLLVAGRQLAASRPAADKPRLADERSLADGSSLADGPSPDA